MRIDDRDREATAWALVEAGIPINEGALWADIQYVVQNGADLQDAARIAQRVEAERVAGAQRTWESDLQEDR